MNKIPNRQVICEALLKAAVCDRDIIVLCSDSRGSAMLGEFAEKFPQQFVETGIAEQNLVSIAAGLAACGKRAFAASPACFLTTRSMEQARIDVAYSNTNVKLIGISGGVSYGALGLSHHSLQDIAVMSSMPNMRVYLPSDRFQTRALIQRLVKDGLPAYIRVGRAPVPDIYDESSSFDADRAVVLRNGHDAALIACGETVWHALEAARLLQARGIGCRVIDMHCLKPVDKKAVLAAAAETRLLVTIEEHGIFGGLGAIVSQITAAEFPARVMQIAFPDSVLISGSSAELFKHYGLDGEGIAKTVANALI